MSCILRWGLFKFSDESRRVGRSLIIANKSIKETENLIFFQCKIEFYCIHEHQNLYFHSWLPPLESRRVGRSLIISNKSIRETENLIFFVSVRSNFISFMNTKTCIVTRGYRHSWKYCFWCPFAEIKFDLTLKKKTTKKTNILYLLLLYFSISNISTINWRTGTLSSEVRWPYRQ